MDTKNDDQVQETPAPAPDPATTDAGTQAGPADLEELKQKAAKADEHWERVLRLTAEFDNYRKRAVREKQEAIRFANEGLLEKLIPILDNFEMALNAAATNTPADSVEALRTGVNMIYQQLKSTLTDAGLEEVQALGQPFDPNLHEAVSQQENADVPEGQVVLQLRKGYRLKERLVRPATVIIAKPPSSQSNHG